MTKFDFFHPNNFDKLMGLIKNAKISYKGKKYKIKKVEYDGMVGDLYIEVIDD